MSDEVVGADVVARFVDGANLDFFLRGGAAAAAAAAGGGPEGTFEVVAATCEFSPAEVTLD